MKYTLVYDGNCRMCARIVRVVREWDTQGAIAVAPAETVAAELRFPWISERQYAESIQLVSADRTTWQGAAAVEQLLAILPHGRWFAWLFRIPLVRPAAEFVYRWIARHRYRLGCSDHCRAG